MNNTLNYNFDEIVNRKNTNSIKHDFAAKMGMPEGLLPLWVADMDFKTAPAVTDALIQSANHSIFGYSETGQDYFEAVKNWFSNRFNYELNFEWLVKTPGVVYAICTAIRAFTEISESVLIQTPVYHPFKESIVVNERRVVNNSLVYKDGKYSIDFDDFENKIVNENVKLFILCSPHNPVGRVWTKEELLHMGDICLKHGVIILSDEIHCDFVYEGNRHYMFPSLGEKFADNSILCTSPSKTFNLAGLQISNIFIANKMLRNKFIREIEKTGYSQLNIMGIAACQSAYEHGSDWLEALNKYLTGNLNYIRDFVEKNLQPVRLIEPEGTYLLWLDFNALSLSEGELSRIIIDKAKLWVNNGVIFGPEGKGFIRINIASPRGIIEEGFCRLKNSL